MPLLLAQALLCPRENFASAAKPALLGDPEKIFKAKANGKTWLSVGNISVVDLQNILCDRKHEAHGFIDYVFPDSLDATQGT